MLHLFPLSLIIQGVAKFLTRISWMLIALVVLNFLYLLCSSAFQRGVIELRGR
jgi:preprotein translocase subunit SecG